LRELQTFQQHDIAHTALGQMVGDAAPDDASADDDDAGLCGQIHGRAIPWSADDIGQPVDRSKDYSKSMPVGYRPASRIPKADRLRR